MKNYNFPKNLKDIFNNFISSYKENKKDKKEQIQFVNGLYGSTFSVFADQLHSQTNHPLLIITSDNENARNIYDDLFYLHGEEKVILFPLLEVMTTEPALFHPTILSQFQNSLIKLAEDKNKIVVLPIETAFIKVLDSKELSNEYYTIKTGDEIDRDTMVEFLIDFGYSRVDAVEELGDLAVRGSLVDVFPYDSDEPIRIEFFGDEIVGIRKFEIISQRSIGKIEFAKFSSHLFNQEKSHPTKTIFEYLHENSIILLHNREMIQNKMEDWKSLDFNEMEIFNPQIKSATVDEIEHKISSFNSISLVHTEMGNKTFHFPFQPPNNFQGSLKLLFNSLKDWKKNNGNLKNFVIYCETKEKKENLFNFIDEELGEEFIPRLITAPLSRGFSFNNHQYMFLTEHEIFNRVKTTTTIKKLQTAGAVIRKMKQMTPGDIVVHLEYGIGQYEGIEQLSIGNNPPKDVVKLIYYDNDSLYVSLDKINKIQKYTSTKENFSPQLSKLGSTEWTTKRKKTKKAIEKIAADLIQLYAVRMTQKGFQFSKDTLWQREMEASFSFEETPDQNKAINDVKKDMQKTQPMDRLICGDVGFGKTEVAIRAAFKAVQENKQVAVLAPTTLLAQQHYHTFSDRLKNFPVNIEVISRFKTRKEQLQTLEKLAAGSVDIIIGTHRLLSSDVNYKSLGLLVVDEEQRFGVTHKEKIKKYKATVDVMTMSATPIPRTLHMALMGARDLSQIETPPKNRLPVYTEITNWDEGLIKKAIIREVKRDGQVFFVHNRVETILGIKDTLQNMLPTVKIAVAHGQMKEKELEKIMEDFNNHKYDVLVSTMIIENGIDIPQCNTILINNAHKFGLAQLYQLRGRVGRSERQAFAYLMAPNIKKLSQDAIKRLYAIQEYTELGSGLKIAMKDLEIRGGGNMLGHQQSGHINTIGYDLYVKLLKETIEKMKESQFSDVKLPKDEKIIETSVDLKTELFFPDEYICSKTEKAFLYYRLGQFNSHSEIKDFKLELEDRFGSIPESAQNLIFMHFLRILGGNNYIQRISLSSSKLLLTFHGKFLEQKTRFDNLIQKIHSFKEFKSRFKQGETLQLHIISENNDYLADNFRITKKLLQEII